MAVMAMLAVGAQAGYLDQFQGEQGEQGEQGVQGEQGSQGNQGNQGYTGANGVDGNDGAAGTNGTNGVDGVDGVSYNDDGLYTLLSKQQSSNAALSSVELNPDHAGFSVGVGVSNRKGDAAGAVGVMYSEVLGTGAWAKSVGYNFKFYNAEGGYRGATAGMTIGF